MGATSDQDPFALFHTPPPNETPGERAARQAKEAEEKRVSDQIDDQLKAERLALKKQKYTVRVLLLGQSESGKSTTLKNFRMRYAKAAWEAERASWRAVIQLNIIRSIITIVETLQAEMDGEAIDQPDTPSTPRVPATPMIAHPPSGEAQSSDSFHYDPLSDPGASPTVVTSFITSRQSSDSLSRTASLSRSTAAASLSTALTGKHQLLKLRLGPLRRVEKDLKKRLGEGAEEERDGVAESLGPLSLESGSEVLVRRQQKEFGVHQLQEALERGTARSGSRRGHGSDDGATSPDDVDEATEVLASCLDDMKTLWSDEVVKVVLKKRRIRLEDSAGFFLDDLDRIARREYEPSDDDVIRARLRTLGVQEYRIKFEANSSVFAGGIGGDAGRDWLLYDVGGSRTMRHAWVPYFDNIQAIIFPVSCFDERLSEDSKVNRLEDSFLLWRKICSSKLLAKATMILFLNKCDLLKRKLKSGVQVKTYLPSFGSRSNDVGTVVKYLREKFKEVLKEHSPEPRSCYFYATSVIDTKATATTIKAVKDSILRDYLKSADFV
ncbi:guanine nucleotide binding protein, alpha subunit [Flammula alnicola]|nr:guanine nucleotide binding protein, alpha subunit [Flammula alnicola]